MREPLAVRTTIVALLTATVHLAVALGLVHWTPEQEAALGGVIDLAGLAIAVLWGRQAVTPLTDPRNNNGTPLVPSVVPPPAPQYPEG